MTDNIRRLGFTSATFLVIASMIGAGVFTISGYALADLQSRRLVLLAWLLGGVVATCGALCYGALGRRFPQSGGEYIFLSRTIHPMAGFMAGWVGLLAGFTAPTAAAALAIEAYLPSLVGNALPSGLAGSVLIVIAGVTHGIRLRVGAVVQNLLVVIMLILIVGFVGFGVLQVPRVSTVSLDILPWQGRWGGLGSTVIWISFAYSGWNAAVYVAGAIERPRRTLPLALLVATLSVTLLYLCLNAVFLYSAPESELSGRPDIGAVAAQALGGPGLRRLLAAIVVVALATSIFSMVMAGPRVIASMARDGLLPSRLGRMSDVPGTAVAAQVVLALIVVWISSLVELLGYVGFTLTLSSAFAVVGLLLCRRKEGAARVPIPGYPWVPSLFVVVTMASAMALAIRDPTTALYGILTAGVGIPMYLWRSKPRLTSDLKAATASQTR